MYRKVEGQVYTRKEYMGGIPHCRISQFDTGNVHQTYRFHYSIVAREAAQVRDQSVEAARVAVVRVMERVASNNFHFKVRKYPHNILREHKMATGAGADRISDGMRLAFGKPVGHAVRANIGDVLFTLSFRSENVADAKEALRKAACKLPMPTSVDMKEDVGVVEGPRAAPIVIEPAPAAPAEAAAEGEAAPAEGEEAAPARTGPPGRRGGVLPSKEAPAKGEAAPAKGTPAPAKPAKPAK
jgi:large subunit ribosomal protein L10e